jgi:hypothetical protein
VETIVDEFSFGSFGFSSTSFPTRYTNDNAKLLTGCALFPSVLRSSVSVSARIRGCKYIHKQPCGERVVRLARYRPSMVRVGKTRTALQAKINTEQTSQEGSGWGKCEDSGVLETLGMRRGLICG